VQYELRRSVRRFAWEIAVFNRIALSLAALAVAALPTAAIAQDLTFQLTNQSSVTITNFYTSPADVEEWQEDVFGDSVFPSGNTVAVTIADGSDQCVYDMKFIAEDGSELVEPGIDLCELEGGEYTLTDAE
jgi:hypothetical protein